MLTSSAFIINTKSDEPHGITPPEIIIEKIVWNGTGWAEYTEVNIGDVVTFGVKIYNPNENDIRFSGYILDTLSPNLRYNKGSSTFS